MATRLSLDQLQAWLAETGCAVTVRPVVDPADLAPVDAYEIPQWMRDAVRLRNLADVFPFGSCTTATMDLDHTIPWRPMEQGGPPGQTRRGNLGPFTRSHHRTVTHGRWRRRQPEPGQFVFRSPTGTIYLVTNQGTLRLGTSPSPRRSGMPPRSARPRKQPPRYPWSIGHESSCLG